MDVLKPGQIYNTVTVCTIVRKEKKIILVGSKLDVVLRVRKELSV